MQLFKFSFYVFCLSVFSSSSYGEFSDSDCLKSSFETTITHKGAPFGLTENRLLLNKKMCVLSITHEKYKFLKSKWVIDVCRQPIHIKKGTSSIEVVKKSTPCPDSKDEFCKEYKIISNILQDDGLIFAEGEKEIISSDHGRVYCSYLLLNAYLGRNYIFTRDREIDGILIPSNSSNLRSGSGNNEALPSNAHSSSEVFDF